LYVPKYALRYNYKKLAISEDKYFNFQPLNVTSHTHMSVMDITPKSQSDDLHSTKPKT
jgi:hypothetical protein